MPVVGGLRPSIASLWKGGSLTADQLREPEIDGMVSATEDSVALPGISPVPKAVLQAGDDDSRLET